MPIRVFADANVFFSRTQRDWLHHLRQATGGLLFTVITSADVIVETLYRYRREHPTAHGRQVAAIQEALEVLADEVITAYAIDQDLPLRDGNDLHVHAAATACGARVLLTCDNGWRCLPTTVFRTLPYDVQHPDDFFVWVDDSAPGAVVQAIREQSRFWAARRGQDIELGGRLRRANCPGFAQRVDTHLAQQG